MHEPKMWCMFVYLFCQSLEKNETSAMIGNKSITRNQNSSKKKTTAKALHCPLSQSDHRQKWQGPRRNSTAASQDARASISWQFASH